MSISNTTRDRVRESYKKCIANKKLSKKSSQPPPITIFCLYLENYDRYLGQSKGKVGVNIITELNTVIDNDKRPYDNGNYNNKNDRY